METVGLFEALTVADSLCDLRPVAELLPLPEGDRDALSLPLSRRDKEGLPEGVSERERADTDGIIEGVLQPD